LKIGGKALKVIKKDDIVSCTVGIDATHIYKDDKKRWVLITVVRRKLQSMNPELYKAFNNNFYTGKYNVQSIFGVTWIDIDTPARSEVSLNITFKMA